MSEARRETSYAIDAADTIVSVGSAWLAFAQANAATDLTPEAVVGRPLWDFIAGHEMRFVYGLVLDRVRSREISIALPFRCDSPEMRRFMELRIVPAESGGVRFTGVLLRADPRRRVALLDPWQPRTSDFLEVCSWCKRVNTPGDGWVTVEDAIVRLGLFEARRLPQLNHSMCRTCEEAVWAELGEDPDRSESH